MLLPLLVCLVSATASASQGGDSPGKRLFLTPYIEAGKIDEAKSLALVPPLKGSVKSYSGFITVDKKCGSNMFFWFFPAESGDIKAPIALWLQGGPGETSLYGLFSENGPYELTPSNKLLLRNYSWTQVSSVLYIDNPVGTGYSYTEFESCYSRNETHIGQNLLSAVKQILQLFPEYKSNPFFITGESYAGKYIPALAYAIHKDKNSKQKINLQGLAIGNGYVDPVNQLSYSDYLFQLGLLDENGRAWFRKVEDKCRALINAKKWREAYGCLDELLDGESSDGFSQFKNLTGFDNYYNYLYAEEPPEGNLTDFMTRNEIRKSVHVGDAIWYNGTLSNEYLIEDNVQSVRPWLEELLEHYRVLLYSGQLDIIVAYPLTVEYLPKLKWSGAEELKTARRHVWRVDKDVAGYAKSAKKLTVVMVRNAGHMVPLDQPKWSLDLLSRFINNKPYH